MISKKYNEILTKLEKNIEDKRSLNIAKSALSDLAICFLDEITKLSDNYNFKISSFETRLADLEKRFLEENEINQVSLVERINCPYCGVEFSIDYDDSKTEIVCPNCGNLIELDWSDFEDDM